MSAPDVARAVDKLREQQAAAVPAAFHREATVTVYLNADARSSAFAAQQDPFGQLSRPGGAVLMTPAGVELTSGNSTEVTRIILPWHSIAVIKSRVPTHVVARSY